MKNTFKYILFTFLLTFIGIISVNAEACYITSEGKYYWGNGTIGSSAGSNIIKAETHILNKDDCKGYAHLSCEYKIDNGNVVWKYEQNTDGTFSLVKGNGEPSQTNSKNISLLKYKCSSKIYYLNNDCKVAGIKREKGWRAFDSDAISLDGCDYKSYSLTKDSSSSEHVKEKELNCKYFSTGGSEVTLVQTDTGTLHLLNNEGQAQINNLHAPIADCPSTLYYIVPDQKFQSTSPTNVLQTNYVKYCKDQKCESNDKNQESNDSSNNTPSDNSTPSDRNYADGCDDAGKTIELLKTMYTFMRFLIPVLIIGLSVVDFIKVVANGEDKLFKSVWSKFVKRIIIGVIILILPALLSVLIRLSGVVGVYGIDDNNIFCIFI